jgi:hypothetical protein
MCADIETLVREAYEIPRGTGVPARGSRPCVFKKVVGDKVYLLLLYIDNILLIADLQELDCLEAEFLKEFQWIMMAKGDSHSHIGMQISMCSGVVTLDMKYYLDCILEGHKNLWVVATTGEKNGFMVNDSYVKLGEERKKQFHLTVTELLHLSKRAQPDIISVVGFLCTSVKEATVEDSTKLVSVLVYLKGTRQIVMRMKPNNVFKVMVYIDASFSLHPDGKLHIGVMIQVGGISVYFGSRKQKCVSKIPMEAELVALLDNVG